MTNYIMPTSMDLPPIRVFFEEVPVRRTARPAPRGSASCRWTAPAPAIVNAVAHATGIHADRIPLTPER